MTLPFIGTDDSGERHLVVSRITGLLGEDEWSARPMGDPSSQLTLPLGGVEPLVGPTDGPEGQMVRLLLADDYLDGSGGGVSLALRANIDFYPFQLRPLLKFHSTAGRRMLIADETGLGKTIEAGMVIAETLAANPDGTIVVLSPSVMINKWRRDLRDKFGIRAFERRLYDFDGRTPPRGVFVVSHDSMREEEGLDVDDGSVDLLVIDEVHRFIGRSADQKRRGRAMCLSRASRGVIGMSATPVQIEVEDLQRVLELIAPGQHPASGFAADASLQRSLNRVIAAQSDSQSPDPGDLAAIAPHYPPAAMGSLGSPLPREDWVEAHLTLQSIGPIARRMTRARARDPDIDLAKERIVTDHMVPLGGHEDLYRLMDECIREMGRHNNRQQLASCPSAAVNILNHIMGSDNPDDGSDWFDDYEPPPVDGGMEEMDGLRRRAEVEMPNEGPKIEKLREVLEGLASRVDDEDRPITKAVVFTHWIPTLKHASRIIRATTDLVVHVIGDQDDLNTVDSKITRFREEGGFAVLFVTDRISMGRDLEMANAMVNMDLPYNPAVLQQRIGRLDRIIQESKFIEIHNLVLEGSLEERILEVVNQRAEVFKGIIGGMEAITGGTVEPESADDAKDLLKALRGRADVDMLASSDVLLRVLDSSLDGEIGERRRLLHPLHARKYLLVKAAMERLGARVEWDEEDGVLRILMEDSMRREVVLGKAFFPWGADRAYAAFEVLDDEGRVVLPMRGRRAVIGPLHPFNAACSALLLSAEGMAPAASAPPTGPSIEGQAREQPRWNWLDGKTRSPCDLVLTTLDIYEGVLRLSWHLVPGASSGPRAAYAEVER